MGKVTVAQPVLAAQRALADACTSRATLRSCFRMAYKELDELLSWTLAHADDWRLSDLRGQHLRALLKRSTDTFAAATCLVDRGYSSQAIMLARPLFEDTVLACWMKWVAAPSFVSQRLTDQEHHAEIIFESLSERYPSLTNVAPVHDRAELPRYEATFGRYGELPWWAVPEIIEAPHPHRDQPRYRRPPKQKNRSLRTLIDELADVAVPTSDRVIVVSSKPGPPDYLIPRLRYLSDVVNWLNNRVLHFTSLGYREANRGGTTASHKALQDYRMSLAQETLLMTYDKLLFVLFQHGNQRLERDYANGVGSRIHNSLSAKGVELPGRG